MVVGVESLGLRIGIDAVTPGASLRPGAGGMRMYITTLSREMAAAEPASEFVLFESPHEPLPELDGIANLRRVVCNGVPASRALRVAYQNSIYPMLLHRARPAVLLATCNAYPAGAPAGVVVVQSLQYFNHPEAYGRLRSIYLRRTVRAAVRRSRLVIAVSEEAKRQVVLLAGADPTRVRVVHHGLPPMKSHRRAAAEPYILTVTTLYRYKNLSRLLLAFALLRAKHQIPHRLRIIGGDADMTAADIHREALAAGVGEYVDLCGPVTHDELSADYAGASLFIYPSLEETFGLPPLEAMSLGAPVVAARAGAIPEVVGDAAVLFDPYDVEDMATGMASVLLDSQRAEKLTQLGYVRAAEFTWSAAARGTLDALREVAELTSSAPVK
jgi:glycosyltransferase involved in cell wall biosynthesis